MARKQREIKVKITLTEGYEKRFTQACLEELEKRDMLRNIDRFSGSGQAAEGKEAEA